MGSPYRAFFKSQEFLNQVVNLILSHIEPKNIYYVASLIGSQQITL